MVGGSAVWSSLVCAAGLAVSPRSCRLSLRGGRLLLLSRPAVSFYCPACRLSLRGGGVSCCYPGLSSLAVIPTCRLLLLPGLPSLAAGGYALLLFSAPPLPSVCVQRVMEDTVRIADSTPSPILSNSLR